MFLQVENNSVFLTEETISINSFVFVRVIHENRVRIPDLPYFILGKFPTYFELFSIVFIFVDNK